MFTKEQKEEFVKKNIEELKKYKTVGILQLNNIPDKLIQLSRNKLRSEVKFIIGKKTLLTKVLEGREDTKPLIKELNGLSAILLSNEDPFKLAKEFRANELKLGAKPNQIAPMDIAIEEGETTLQPGQAVTEIKQAGIDVQIQKGKVVIAKSKVLVKAGNTISLQVAKALKTLNILPFKAVVEPTAFVYDNMLFTKDILNITTEQLVKEITEGFMAALNISIKAKIINKYTIDRFIVQAYNEAVYLGVEYSIYEPGIADKLIAKASSAASSINSMVK
ncbi:MAG: 50S ribosomal protein L10 [Candidatus Micrarchaeia archaeon]